MSDPTVKRSFSSSLYYEQLPCFHCDVFCTLQTRKTGSANTQRPTGETAHVYEEALHNLDAAAEKAVQLFSKLANQHVRIEKSREHENQLLAKAAEMLVPIANKIHATAKLAQSANTGSNGNTKIDISTDEI